MTSTQRKLPQIKIKNGKKVMPAKEWFKGSTQRSICKSIIEAGTVFDWYRVEQELIKSCSDSLALDSTDVLDFLSSIGVDATLPTRRRK